MLQNVADVSGQGNHGALQGQTSTTTAVGKIGQALTFEGGGGAYRFSGNMDDVRICNRALSASDITRPCNLLR